MLTLTQIFSWTHDKLWAMECIQIPGITETIGSPVVPIVSVVVYDAGGEAKNVLWKVNLLMQKI